MLVCNPTRSALIVRGSIARLGLLLGAVFAFPLLAQEPFTISGIPNPRGAGGWVSDPAGLIEAADTSGINALITHIERKTGAEIAVVVLPSIGQAVPKDFATELLNTWHVGKKDRDNGLLLLIVLDQHRWEIETGYGMEGDLPDAVCKRIGEESLVPALRAGRMGDGIYEAVSAIARRLGASPEAADEALTRSIGPGNIGGQMRGGSGLLPEGTAHAWGILGTPQASVYMYAAAACIYFLVGSGLAVRRLVRNRALSIENASDPYQQYQAFRNDHGPGFYIAVVLFPLPMLILLLLNIRSLRRLRNTPRHCSHCHKPMQKLDEKADDLFLEEGRRKEEELGSVDYDVWHCAECDRVKIYSYDPAFTSYTVCQVCSYKTYHCVGDRTLLSPTCLSAGRGERDYRCEHCAHTARESYTIPRRDCSKSSSGGWSSSGGSSSSSGGSFGGGSSGGGGAGGSW